MARRPPHRSATLTPGRDAAKFALMCSTCSFVRRWSQVMSSVSPGDGHLRKRQVNGASHAAALHEPSWHRGKVRKEFLYCCHRHCLQPTRA